jgi:MFS superfamily sulfate permease-like transporter
MLSLMSAAALISFATPGSPKFIELSVMLALMVGALRLALGLLRLGVVVNFLSGPVILGFTNAAALIIGLSLLSQIIGVPFPRTDSYLSDLWQVLLQIPETHWPTLLFAAGTWIVIRLTARFLPALPGILVAVVLATLLSWAIGFESKVTVAIDQVRDPATRAQIEEYRDASDRIEGLASRLTDLNGQLRVAGASTGDAGAALVAATEAEIRVLAHSLGGLKARRDNLRVALHAHPLAGVREQAESFALITPEQAPTDGRKWRFAAVTGNQVTFSAGGAVVGAIPRGLPLPSLPPLRADLIVPLLPAALVMALIGFVEATSISKAIATTTRQRVDTNQELVGQGLANIAGSFFSAYAVSGSFSRSAVAARAGARTGLSAIISVGGVVLALLFLTPYLYHLPQATLAVVVMMAVFGLIRIEPLIHAWRVDPPAAAIGSLTFFTTLVMAPNLASGIMLGVALTVLWYLIRNMRPHADILGRQADGTLGGVRAHGLTPLSKQVVPLRFDGSLVFINVAYFEDIVLEAQADYPDARAILVIGSGINEIDASGEEKVRDLALRLREAGVELTFSGLKQQVLRVFERGGLLDLLGHGSFFADKERAVSALAERYGTAEASSDRVMKHLPVPGQR